jgi:hypothetical protein
MSKNHKEMARKLGFRAIHTNWEEYRNEPWLVPLLEAEEAERGSRSVQKRVRDAKMDRVQLELADACGPAAH